MRCDFPQPKINSRVIVYCMHVLSSYYLTMASMKNNCLQQMIYVADRLCVNLQKKPLKKLCENNKNLE